MFTLKGWSGLSTLLDVPVCHMSFFEAEAFARWRGCRLPTEAEWEHVATQASSLSGNLLNTGRLHPAKARGLRNSFNSSETVGNGPPALTPAIPAIQASPWSARRIQRQIHVRPDGSARRVLRHSRGSHPRITYRNFFQPETRWQFSGIRLAIVEMDSRTWLQSSIAIDLERLISIRYPRDVDPGGSARPAYATPDRLPPWMFYDARGSSIFERITEIPEYYPTRTERGILARCCDAIISAACPVNGGSPAPC